MSLPQSYIDKYRRVYGHDPVNSPAPGPRVPVAIIGPPVQPWPVKQPPVEILYPPTPVPIRTGPPRPPIRVGPMPIYVPPVAQPPYASPHHRRRHEAPYRRQRHRPHRSPYAAPPIKVAPTPVVAPPIVPVATGKICPSWGWMVRTNADGSETVVQCQPGQPGAVGLHGLESITGTLEGALGPNWMLYIGGALATWFLLKRR